MLKTSGGFTNVAISSYTYDNRRFDVIKCIFWCSLQLVVGISSVSPISLGYCANSSFITQLLGELTGDDVLVR